MSQNIKKIYTPS